MAFKDITDKFFALLKQPEERIENENFPEKDRWWTAKERPATPEEEDITCKHCRNPIGLGGIKKCPGCGVVLHSKCYDDTEGGLAYQTQGCDACRHRCYWK